MNQENPRELLYKIGAVSKITGIGIETLRMWERRYGAVKPQRGKGTSRLYNEDDISRLTLLKQLVDKGNSISTVANLDRSELVRRLESIEKLARVEHVGAGVSSRRLKTAVCGRSLTINFKMNARHIHTLDITNYYEGISQLHEAEAPEECDVLILELPVIHQDDVPVIKQAAAHAGCAHVMVIYAYCNKKILKTLKLEEIDVQSAPIVPGVIDRRCQELYIEGPVSHPATLDIDADVPPFERRFKDDTLARVANCSTSINCECPHHLADIIYKLAAFEDYSESCESRSVEDKQLHSMLFRVTNQTRALFEDTLARVIEYEGIEVDE